jgi:UDP-2,3-diacylglucosamine pyrophosphatase LpxH
MLAIISDLHFCDGTATEKNVNPKAFELALGEIYTLAAEVARKRDRPTRLDLVLLGDVFDLLRTERWFEDRDGVPVPLSERPWGSVKALDRAVAAPAVIARASLILDEILTENAAALGMLRGESAPPPTGVEVRRLYLPGNHDRLYLHDATIAARIRAALGAVDPAGLEAEGIFPRRLEMSRYGLLARHGHEWDEWNFESFRAGAAPAEYADQDYLPTPIGDPIATELAARLPYEIRGRLADSKRVTPEEREHIYHRMQRIEDVRPLLASFQWAYYEADRLDGTMGLASAAEVRQVVDATVKDLADRFRNLDFFKAWVDKHNRALRIDSADLLKAALYGLSRVSFASGLRVANRFEGLLSRSEPRDTCRQGAAREDLRTVGRRGLRFVAYGHTHSPLEVALAASNGTSNVYLNSGTFRQGVFRTDDKRGFIGWERLTFLCFFAEDEVEAGGDQARFGPSFTTWTGARAQ